jgi:murein DD-endopeptidase MepM/ murein hydrolase activator NlpD
LGSVLGAAVVASAGFAVLDGGLLRAKSSRLGSAAAATEPAVRTRLDDLLEFPVLPGDGLIALNNFGGRSVSTGACSHRGIDIFPTTEATRILVSCIDGVIGGQRLLAGSQGNSWILQDGAGVSYRYHHIDEFEPGLEVGSVVRRGDVLGTMGSTGNARNPHLHFEVRPDGTGASAVDPVPLLPFPIDGVILGEPTGCA